VLPGPAAQERSARVPVGIFVGLCTLDVVHEVERLPAVDEKVTALSQSIASGGPATNAAVTFAALGGRSTLVTAVGRGALADTVRADLASFGVDLRDAAGDRLDAVPVASICVLSTTGERSVVSVDAGLISVQHAPDLTDLLASADVLLADGHHRTLAAAAAEGVAASSTPLLIDAGRWRPAMAALLKAADTVVCSADFRLPGSPDPASSAGALATDGVPTVAVTEGAGPVRWWSGGRSGSVQPPAVEAVDTVGAGDALHGAYAFAMAAAPGSSPQQRLEFAVQVASLKCTFPGTRSWLPELSRRADTLRDQLLGTPVNPSRPRAHVAARDSPPPSP
jgi:sugar/nucleoside kinase (ribokinase family)